MSRTTHRLTTTAIALLLVAALGVLLYLSSRHGRDDGKSPATVASTRGSPASEIVDTPPGVAPVMPSRPAEPSTPASPEMAAMNTSSAAPQRVTVAPPPMSDGDGIALLLPRPSEPPPSKAVVVAAAADTVTYVAFAPDGRLLVARAGGRIDFVNVATGQRHAVETKVAALRAVALSPDGDRIAIANGEDTLIWHVTSASATPIAGGDVTTLAFARGGGLVTGHANGEVKLWETPGWANVATIQPGIGAVGRIAFSPTALQAAAVGASGGVAVCDPRDRQVKQRLAADKAWASVDFSPDGHTLAAAGPRGVALWDTIVWQARPAPGGDDAATFASFWRSGGALVIAGADGAIRIFDVATRQLLTTLEAKSAGPIASLALGGDDRTIAASNGTGVLIWDSATRASRPVP